MLTMSQASELYSQDSVVEQIVVDSIEGSQDDEDTIEIDTTPVIIDRYIPPVPIDTIDSLALDTNALDSALIQVVDSVSVTDEDTVKKEVRPELGTKRNKFGEDWFVIVLIVILILIASLRLFYPKYLELKFNSLFSQIIFREQLESITSFYHSSGILFQLVKILIFSSAIFIVMDKGYDLPIDGLGLFIYVLAAVAALVILKLAFSKAFAALMQIAVFERKLTLLQSGVDVIFLSIVFPLVAFLYYGDYLSNSTQLVNVFMISALTVYFVSKLLISLIQNKDTVVVNKFLLFVYLCTFEILPFIILVKLLEM
jgi:hypothetical protein